MTGPTVRRLLRGLKSVHPALEGVAIILINSKDASLNIKFGTKLVLLRNHLFLVGH